MATAQVVLGQEVWERRARELAEAHQMMARGPYVYEDAPDGDRFYHVPSQSEPGTVHEVKHTQHGLRCDCTAGQYCRPCSHVGAVLRLQRVEQTAADRDMYYAAYWAAVEG